MRWLPLVSDQRQTSRLPFTEQDAERLELALLAPASDSEHFYVALLGDCPALAHWIADRESVTTCQDAARWCAKNLLLHLNGSSDELGWQRLSERAAGEIQHHTAEHIAFGAPDSSEATSTDDPEATEFAQLVAVGERIEKALTGHSAETGQAPTENDTNHANIAGDGVWHRLRHLIALLWRLRQLEDEFDVRLEHEKIEAMKELAYGAGHEVNNPLANISARAQTLIKDETDPQRRRKLAAINAQAYRAHEMIADLMLFARPPKLEPENVDLGELAEQVIAELQPTCEERSISIRAIAPTSAVLIEADRVQLGVVLAALCKNSIEALGLGGHVELSVQSAEEAWAEIVVRDDGPGIEPEIRPHIFDPFFSGREAGRGLGFGLSKAWRIVTDHGGQILVDSQAGRGATFTVRLPTRSSNAAVSAASL